MASEVPREKLKELMEKNGDSLLQDRDRCEGLLKDYCGGHRREISALVGALEERVPLELKSSWQTAMTPEAMRARLVQRLEDNRGLAPEIANYAVDTWSYALGVGLGRSSARVQDVPVPHVNGYATGATDAERGAADRPGSLPAAAPVVPPVVVKAGMSNQNKAVVGGMGLLAAAAIAFALLHHPAPTLPAGGPDVQHGQNPQNPTPPVPNVQNPQAGQNNPPPAPDGQTKPDTEQNGQSAANHSNAGRTQQAKLSSVTAGASVAVRLDRDFNSDNSNVGELLPATVVSPLLSEGNVVVQQGSSARLKVIKIDKSGKISGKSHVEFALVGLTAHGKLMHISGASKGVDGPSQGARTAERTGIGGAAGAAIGALAGHLFHHAGTGAAAGAGAGGTAGALTSHPAPVKVGAETVLLFRLTKGIPTGS
jgi:hypothetical protein